jgi:hypothetical protein
MEILLVNTSDVQVQPTIVNAETGQRTEVFIQPKSRAKLPAGFEMDTQWSAQNPSVKSHTLQN